MATLVDFSKFESFEIRGSVIPFSFHYGYGGIELHGGGCEEVFLQFLGAK